MRTPLPNGTHRCPSATAIFNSCTCLRQRWTCLCARALYPSQWLLQFTTDGLTLETQSFLKLGVLSWSVGPFPAYDGTVSVLVSRAVVAMVGSKTSYVCRSSVRSVREGMTFLDFMSVSLNYFGHLCTCKLGHLFSFLLLLALGQRKKEFSLLSAISLPIVFSTKHFILWRLHFSDIPLPQWLFALHSVCLLSTKSAYHVAFPVVFFSV